MDRGHPAVQQQTVSRALRFCRAGLVTNEFLPFSGPWGVALTRARNTDRLAPVPQDTAAGQRRFRVAPQAGSCDKTTGSAAFQLCASLETMSPSSPGTDGSGGPSPPFWFGGVGVLQACLGYESATASLFHAFVVRGPSVALQQHLLRPRAWSAAFRGHKAGIGELSAQLPRADVVSVR